MSPDVLKRNPGLQAAAKGTKAKPKPKGANRPSGEVLPRLELAERTERRQGRFVEVVEVWRAGKQQVIFTSNRRVRK